MNYGGFGLRLVAIIIAGFTEKRQALHDIIASTLVIKKNPSTTV